jgi:MYXO-CTERM domain-containing protein
MRKYWNIFGLLFVMALAVTESSSAAPATTTFNFSGRCSDCSGTATASLVLVGSYTLGTPITSSNFVSFTYNGTNLTGPFTYTPSSTNFSVSGSMTNIPGANAFYVVGSNAGVYFDSVLNGNWNVGLSDQGTAGTWSMAGGSVSATPAPPTSILLVIGLMALTAFGVWQRRRKTA